MKTKSLTNDNNICYSVFNQLFNQKPKKQKDMNKNDEKPMVTAKSTPGMTIEEERIMGEVYVSSESLNDDRQIKTTRPKQPPKKDHKITNPRDTLGRDDCHGKTPDFK